jgi:hypothetical protein
MAAEHEDARQAAVLVERVGPLLDGQPCAAIGIALADLVAMYLAGHVIPGDPGGTETVRGILLGNICELVGTLVPINERIIIRDAEGKTS